MLSVRVYLVILVVTAVISTENETKTTITETTGAATHTPPTMTVTDVFDPMTEEAVTLPDVYVSYVICNVCNCTGDSVDCRNRDLSQPFEVEDWEGLQDLGNLDYTSVDLSGNAFVLVSQFPKLPIRNLNLSNCEIEILEDATFSNLKNLSVLDLSWNKMSFAIGKRAFLGVLEDGRKPMPFRYLQRLSLIHNDIHSLSQDVFAFMPHLTFLDLSSNPLVSIDQVTMGALADLMKLEDLRISECDLETLPMGIFRRLRRLQRLDISGNRFTVVPAALGEAIHLQYLNFNTNPIQSLSQRTVISNLTKLRELHLSRNSKLRAIAAGSLGGLQSLVKLHVSYNPRLSVLDSGFLEWEDDLGVVRKPLLEELYLNNNNISGIESKLLDHWDRLTRVDFTANPYLCDCSNRWMVDVLIPLIADMMANTAKMICRNPYDCRGVTFAQLYESGKELPCPLSDGLTDASAVESAVLYGVLIGTLISFPIVLVLVILWKNGYFARCRKKMNSNREYFDDEETDAF